MKIEVDIQVYSGKVLQGRNALKKALQSMGNSNLTVTIEPKKRRRTHPQNNLWWVYMSFLSEHTGYSKDEMHEICKYQFLLTEKTDEKTGLIMPYVRSTTELNKDEFSQLIESLYLWASDSLGVNLPEPNEQMDIFN